MEYTIIIEDAGANLAAYAPDVPGCGVAGESVEEVTALLREALALHLADLVATGQPLPRPVSRAATVDVAFPVPSAPAEDKAAAEDKSLPRGEDKPAPVLRRGEG